MQATYTEFFRAGDQLMPQVYSYTTVVTTNLNSDAPILTITLIAPALIYTTTSAQLAGAVIISVRSDWAGRFLILLSLFLNRSQWLGECTT